MELPAFAEGGLEELVGFVVVGDAHLVGIVFELAFVAQRDDAEQHPLDKGRGDIEVGAGRVAAFAGADQVAHVAGRAGQQRRRASGSPSSFRPEGDA